MPLPAPTLRRAALSLSALATLVCAGCSEVAPTPTETQGQAAIFGTDNRSDAHAYPIATWQDMASRTTAIQTRPAFLDLTNPANVTLNAYTLGETNNLCPGEPFADQPVIGTCSATLIDDDLLLTAGHCVAPATCHENVWVFNYAQTTTGDTATLTTDDVYSCSSVVVHRDDAEADYAIVRLDRAATPRQEVARVHRAAEPVPVDSALWLLGYPSGLPLKITDGGRVVADGAPLLQEMVTNLDSYRGDSGSGVFTSDYALVGVVVTGPEDWAVTGTGCHVSNVLSEDAGSTGVTYAFRAVEALCAAGFASTLCTTPAVPVCGDDICERGEDPSCPECACQNGICEPGEDTRCPSECADVPLGWHCQAQLYGSGDGCHCECGAPDPDCAVEDPVTYNCGLDQVCGSAGMCITPVDDTPADQLGDGTPVDREVEAELPSGARGCQSTPAPASGLSLAALALLGLRRRRG